MKNIYKEFFEITNDKKISTQVLINRMMISMSIIVICLMMTCVSAYAYFCLSITSHNTITSAFFSLSIENKHDISENNGSYELNNNSQEPQSYYFLLDKANSTASVGYAKVELINTHNNEKTDYYVKSLGETTEGTIQTRAIQITIPTGQYKLSITPEWGTCSKDTIDTEMIKEISVSDYESIVIENTNEEELQNLSIDDSVEEVIDETITDTEIIE